MREDMFFVLKGLWCGEEGNKAVPCGNDQPLDDGWYFLLPDEVDPSSGPYESREQAERMLSQLRGFIGFDGRATIDDMAKAALPVDDDDWGSERQIKAENAFFTYVERCLPPHIWEDIGDYSYGATVEERVDYATNKVKEFWR